jgi:hypothetical protein
MALLTLETEINGDSKSTNKRGPSLVCLLGLLCPYKRFLICLGCSSRPSAKIFFVTVHCSIPLSPSPSNLGRQPCWVACLLVCVSETNKETSLEGFLLVFFSGYFWIFYVLLIQHCFFGRSLRFHYAGGCWDWIQHCCDFDIGGQTL